jgi:N-acetylmuramoyl-L-alanine amidase
MADPTSPSTSTPPGPLDAAEATAPTPTELAIRQARQARPSGQARPPRQAEPGRKPRPLRSITIALDPGHQLGNARYPRQTGALAPAGGFQKPCNTTGTATNSGVAEATVNLRLARAVRKRLRSLGARVPMTRTTNSARRWGPCVNTRGQFGKRVGAQLMVSLHADGASSSGRGFHVIAPSYRAPWTSDIASSSLRLATSLRNGLTAFGVPRSNYTGGGTGLNVRNDLGTLNMSDVPVAMIEIGNMRNTGDARRMTSRSGRARYANAVVWGIRTFLGR